MLTQEELSRLNADDRARYERASALDRPYLEKDLREKLNRRANAPTREMPDLFAEASFLNGPSTDTGGTYYGSEPSPYRAARFVIAVEDFFGKLLLVIGALWFLWSAFSIVSALQDTMRYGGVDLGTALGFLSIGSLLPSLACVVAAIMIVAHGQMPRATLDTADDTRELVEVTKALLNKRR